MSDDRQWPGTTYGNGWMHRALVFVLRYVDVRLLYIFASIFVVPPCIILKNSNFRAIYRYFRQSYRYSPLRSFCMTYINHCHFSQVIIDKFAMYAGKHFDIKIDGYSYFHDLEMQNEGFIQLSSHIGNFEIAGYTLISKNKTMNAIVFANEKESVMRNRMKMFKETNVHMIPIKSDMSHLFEINAALENNEILSMPADRLIGSQKSIKIEFLGNPASFPIGPYALAAMRGLRAIALNVMKTGLKQYTIYVSPLKYDNNASQVEKVQQLATNYVNELEQKVKAFPTQWFNYFDFWNQ